MSWKSLIDKALGTDFNKPQYDPAAGRKKLVKQIDLAAKQHKEGTTRAPNRAWKAGGTSDNPSIRFAPKIEGKPVLLDGDDHVFVPASRFQDFLTGLKASVEAGELDKEIKTALDGKKPASSSTTTATRSGGGRDALSNVRSSISRSISNGKTLEEAEATARKKGKYSDADISAVIAENRAAQAS